MDSGYVDKWSDTQNVKWETKLETTGNGSLQVVNQRRQLLDRHWRKLIAEVRKVFTGKLSLFT